MSITGVVWGLAKEKKDRTMFLGRNGWGWCTGVNVELDAKEKWVTISPVTSQTKIGRCVIEVPVEALGDVIRVLKAIRK